MTTKTIIVNGTAEQKNSSWIPAAKRKSKGWKLVHAMGCTNMKCNALQVANLCIKQIRIQVSRVVLLYCDIFGPAELVWYVTSWLIADISAKGGHRKVVNAQHKCLVHHFGGMLELTNGLHFFLLASEIPFFALKNGQFWFFVCLFCYGTKEERGIFGQITQYQIREEVPQKTWKEKNGDKLGGGLVKWIKRSRETKVALPTNPLSS